MGFNKEGRRKRIHYRIRKKVRGTAARPRLAIYRSNKEIYAQVIDDVNGVTLCSASSRDKGFSVEGPKVEQAKSVGKKLAENAQSASIDNVVFDRGGYLYHGRVKALADGAREGGMKF
ncbi:MAG: large subunit ribosomal protein L18 [Paraglaciecola sp.]|jgi:large subunit ribosomal protein L18